MEQPTLPDLESQARILRDRIAAAESGLFPQPEAALKQYRIQLEQLETKIAKSMKQSA